MFCTKYTSNYESRRKNTNMGWCVCTTWIVCVISSLFSLDDDGVTIWGEKRGRRGAGVISEFWVRGRKLWSWTLYTTMST